LESANGAHPEVVVRSSRSRRGRRGIETCGFELCQGV